MVGVAPGAQIPTTAVEAVEAVVGNAAVGTVGEAAANTVGGVEATTIVSATRRPEVLICPQPAVRALIREVADKLRIDSST